MEGCRSRQKTAEERARRAEASASSEASVCTSWPAKAVMPLSAPSCIWHVACASFSPKAGPRKQRDALAAGLPVHGATTLHVAAASTPCRDDAVTMLLEGWRRCVAARRRRTRRRAAFWRLCWRDVIRERAVRDSEDKIRCNHTKSAGAGAVSVRVSAAAGFVSSATTSTTVCGVLQPLAGEACTSRMKAARDGGLGSRQDTGRRPFPPTAPGSHLYVREGV